MTLEREHREPATEAGRTLYAYLREIAALVGRDFDASEILAIEAQATDARVAALVEALDDMAAAEENEQKRAYIRKLLSDLPAAAAERPLDVERLARAIAAAWPGWLLRQPGANADAVAAEYARLS